MIAADTFIVIGAGVGALAIIAGIAVAVLHRRRDHSPRDE